MRGVGTRCGASRPPWRSRRYASHSTARGAQLPQPGYARGVSDYYDLLLAVDLRPDLPVAVLDELRWHLGLTESAPAMLAAADFEGWGGAWRVFEGGVESHGFDGADTATWYGALAE